MKQTRTGARTVERVSVVLALWCCLGLLVASPASAELFGKKAAKATPAASTPEKPEAPPAVAGSAGEKIAYTFTDDAKMEGFAKLSQQRQGIFVRMTVLQAYFNEEQAALAQLNTKLTKDYNLDMTKNYSLDNKRRVLIEREAPPAAPQAVSATPVEPAKTQ